MVQQLEQLQRATSRQLVVATVSSLEGNEIQDYAYRLGRQWGIGQSEANNGVVLLVAPNERRVWITIGYGLEGILTDAFTGQVVRDQIVPRFRENDYPGGIEGGVNALIAQLAAPPEQAEQRALEAERARAAGRRARQWRRRVWSLSACCSCWHSLSPRHRRGPRGRPPRRVVALGRGLWPARRRRRHGLVHRRRRARGTDARRLRRRRRLVLGRRRRLVLGRRRGGGFSGGGGSFGGGGAGGSW